MRKCEKHSRENSFFFTGIIFLQCKGKNYNFLFLSRSGLQSKQTSETTSPLSSQFPFPIPIEPFPGFAVMAPPILSMALPSETGRVLSIQSHTVQVLFVFVPFFFKKNYSSLFDLLEFHFLVVVVLLYLVRHGLIVGLLVVLVWVRDDF